MLAPLYPDAPPLSPLILGTSTFGREITRDAACTLMDTAFARGISQFDTAATYSLGESEKIVGRWLETRSPGHAKLCVATKIYPPYTAHEIDVAVAGSARRLGVEAIDVLYLHKWDATAETPTALAELDRLRRGGRVKSLGVSNFSAIQLRRILQLQKELEFPRFRILQNNNNLALREIDRGLVRLCRKQQMAVATYSPLGAGFLTGKHQNGAVPGSRFALVPAHQESYFQPGPESRLARLAAVARRTGLSMPHLALAWAMHQPGVDSVIIGGREPAHLDQAFAALDFRDDRIFAELAADGSRSSHLFTTEIDEPA